MARTFDARRRAHLRTTDQRLLADQRRMARAIGLLFAQAPTTRNADGVRVIRDTRQGRDALKQAAWERVLKPYYLGPTGEALRGQQPQSPYARLLVEGVTGAVQIQVKAQIALLRRSIRDEAVLAWLLSPQRPLPARETIMDSFSQWLDPRGFRLGDRIQRMAIEVRSRLNRFIDYHMARGTLTVEMVDTVQQFLTTGERQRRPYGQQGGYTARRLLRNELIVAGGWAALNMSQVNPIVAGVQWQLSRADTDKDQCDRNSRGGPNGDGVYPPGEVPPYPDHPGEACYLVPVATTNPAAVTVDLATAIAGNTAEAQALQGLFNDEWLIQALLSGVLVEAANALGVT